MYRCKSCGKEIDDYQYKNFEALCSECIRLNKSSERTEIGRALQLTQKIDSKSQNAGALLIFGIWLSILSCVGIFVGTFFGLTDILPFGILGLVVGIGVLFYTFKSRQKIKKLREELNTIQ